MLFSYAFITLLCTQPPAQKPFEFKDGDRIVWIGNTLVEREQRYGYWETALLVANKDKQITFRNLGWSGDTVYGDARAGFDNAAKGFERLVSLTLELKPTVIFVSYGINEAFEGKEGLVKFEKGLEKLLDALAPAQARTVLFSPMPFEIHKRFPESVLRNDMLEKYTVVIRKVAENRKQYFADLFHEAFKSSTPRKDIYDVDPKQFSEVSYTENGMHLSELGYQSFTSKYLTTLGRNVPNGRFSKGDNKNDEMRKAVVAKNQLFFYRWRPQNETYLFGFRKHEQGKNAKEVAEFDPLVGKAEEEIQKLLMTIQSK